MCQKLLPFSLWALTSWRAVTCWDEPGWAWAVMGSTTSPPGLGHPHPSVQLKPIIHYEEPTKLKHLCPPRATLEMATSRTDKSQPGSKFGQRNQADQFNFLFQIGFTLWGPGTSSSEWRPPAVPSPERKIRAELCGNSFPCGFSDKWFLNSDTPEVNLRNRSEPQSKPASCAPPICLRRGRICPVNQMCPQAHGAAAHTQPLIWSWEGLEGKTQAQRCRTEVRPASSSVMACQRDGTSLLPARWHRTSAPDTVSPFEADGISKPPHKPLQSRRELPISSF